MLAAFFKVVMAACFTYAEDLGYFCLARPQAQNCFVGQPPRLVR